MIKFEEVKGINDLLKGFDEVGTAAFEEVENATMRVGEKILTVSKAKAPGPTGRTSGKWAHLPGNLKEKIKLKKPTEKQKSKGKVFSTVSFGSGAAYGVPVELGHKLIIHGKSSGVVSPVPFLRPAADMYRSVASDEIEKAINAAVGKW